MRTEKPTGKEIAKKAKKIKLYDNLKVHGKKNGKDITFTQANIEHVKSLEELEDGHVIGVVENQIVGDETDLPIGKHNLFITNIKDKWHVYAENGGNIVGEAKRVELKEYKFSDRISRKATFKPEGWCLSICIGWFFGFCIVRISLCF